ncbi:tyrosine phosphatase family protein [Propylenella binzhouense]|uniref:Protein tyrosine phosphatase n=1 Tax=Propylenella binzhouense TaxID=2555902 RepID=A0A964T454_9HYPH|nr:tyrosine phosphatase family protein [Propylenella binzhouense]MYZ48151.1 protein tyrosine phosphatase [Propylenella binzhouense]
MSTIHVCPLSRLGETVEICGARHVVTLLGDLTRVSRPACVSEADHLVLGFNDIAEPMEGFVAPGEAHVRRFLDFVQRWDRSAPLVIHCFAGVSRSTAAAYTALCALRPDLDEEQTAWRLRSLSPQATPNRLFVSIADALLARDGRMIAAVERIGRGADCFEGTVFSLDVADG